MLPRQNLDYGFGITQIELSYSDIYVTKGCFFDEKDEVILRVHPKFFNFSKYYDDDIELLRCFVVPIQANIIAASNFPPSYDQNEIERVAILTSDYQLMVCSFYQRKLKISHITCAIPDHFIKSGNTPKLICLSDYLVIHFFPNALFVVPNDDEVLTLREIPTDENVSATFFANDGNLLYMNSISENSIYCLDVDKIISYALMQEEEDLEEEEKDDFMMKTLSKEYQIDNMFLINDKFYLFSYSEMEIVPANDLENSKVFSLPISDLVVKMLVMEDGKIFIFYEKGEIYKFNGMEFIYQTLGPHASSVLALGPESYFVGSRTGSGMAIKEDKVVAQSPSQPLISSLAVVPETKKKRQRLISSSGEIFGAVITYGESIDARNIAQNDVPNCLGLFYVRGTILISIPSGTAFVGEKIPEIDTSKTTLFAAEHCGKIIQIANDIAYVDGKEFAPANDARTFEEFLILIFRNQITLYKGYEKVSETTLEIPLSAITVNPNGIYISTWEPATFKFDFELKQQKRIEAGFNAMASIEGNVLVCDINGNLIIYSPDFDVILTTAVATRSVYLAQGNNRVLVCSEYSFLITMEDGRFEIKKVTHQFNLLACFITDWKLVVADPFTIATLEIIEDTKLFWQTSINYVPGDAIMSIPTSDSTFITLIEDDINIIAECKSSSVNIGSKFNFTKDEVLCSFDLYREGASVFEEEPSGQDLYVVTAGSIFSEDPLFCETGILYVIKMNATPSVEMFEKLPHAATAVRIHNNLCYIAVGSDINIYEFAKDEDDGKMKLKQVGQWKADTATMRIVAEGDRLIVFDIVKSIKVLKIVGNSLELDCADLSHTITMAAAFIDETDILTGDSEGILRVLRKTDDYLYPVASLEMSSTVNEIVRMDLPHGSVFFVGTSNGELLALTKLPKEKYVPLKTVEMEAYEYIESKGGLKSKALLADSDSFAFADLTLVQNIYEDREIEEGKGKFADLLHNVKMINRII